MIIDTFAPIMSQARHIMKFHSSNRARGYLSGAIAASSYGMNPLLAMPLFAIGVNSDSMLCYRYSLAVVMLAIFMYATKKSFRLTRQQIPLMALFSIMFAFSSLLLFESYRFMDVGIASTILFVYPVFVAIINALFYRERVSIVTIVSIAMALGGIILLYCGGDSEANLSVTGTILVILSSLSYALYMVAINRTSLRSIPSMTLTFYSVFFGQIVFFVRIFFWSGFTPVEGTLPWLCAAGLALFPTVISLLTMAVAIHDIGSTATAILGALEPVTALIIGVGVFGERLTIPAAIGILMVLTAVTLLIVAKPLARILRQVLVRRPHRAD